MIEISKLFSDFIFGTNVKTKLIHHDWLSLIILIHHTLQIFQHALKSFKGPFCITISPCFFGSSAFDRYCFKQLEWFLGVLLYLIKSYSSSFRLQITSTKIEFFILSFSLQKLDMYILLQVLCILCRYQWQNLNKNISFSAFFWYISK